MSTRIIATGLVMLWWAAASSSRDGGEGCGGEEPCKDGDRQTCDGGEYDGFQRCEDGEWGPCVPKK